MAEEYKIVTDTDETFVTTRDATAANQGLVLAGTLLTATAAELNRAADLTGRVVDCTASTLAVTAAAHDGRTVTLNRAGGIAVTLPAASGSGARFRFIIGTTFTSPATIKVANSSDTMAGNAVVAQDGGDTAVIFEAGATADTITWDGSTTGGLKGTIVELDDIAANLWFVRSLGAATGTEATPFSATV